MLRPSIFQQTQPLTLFEQAQQFMNNFYNDFFGNSLNYFENFSTDVVDKGDHYLVQAELPGFNKEDINISLENEALTISASHQEESKEDKNNYVRQERRSNAYSRSFHVNGIREEDISASYNNGLLELKLPKEQGEAVQPKRIEIK